MAFKALNGVEIEPWELRALFALDEVRLAGKDGAIEHRDRVKPRSLIAGLKALAKANKKSPIKRRNHRNAR